MAEKKEYQGKPRGGAGLGQGKKTKKDFKKKTFSLQSEIVKILEKYGVENGYKKGTITNFVEIAIVDLHKHFQDLLLIPETEVYENFQENKQKLFQKVVDFHNAKKEKNGE